MKMVIIVYKKIVISIIALIILKYSISESRKLTFFESTLRDTSLLVNRVINVNKEVTVKNEKALKTEIEEL